jgi:predicted transglutaminase-like cysteine proteinase
MKLKAILLGGTLLALLAMLLAASHALAFPSKGFHIDEGEVFDEWGLCRTRAYGSDGFFQVSAEAFRPAIVFESLGEKADLAFKWGKEFATKYPDKYALAEAIFRFARDHIKYTTDTDQFGYKDFARNADELAHDISRDGLSRGDCEDYAVLLATMFKGAGLRSAIVIAPGHAAALVHLPGYRKATSFHLNGEAGWVWAEATGRGNPLGWVPKQYLGEMLLIYEISQEAIFDQGKEPIVWQPEKEGFAISASPFIGVLTMMWFVPLLMRMLVFLPRLF